MQEEKELSLTSCTCVVLNREPYESQREWFKRWMCMFHWMQTDYYQAKLEEGERDFEIDPKNKRVLRIKK